MNNLAASYHAAGERGTAISLFELALAYCILVLGENHSTSARVRDNLAIARGERR